MIMQSLIRNSGCAGCNSGIFAHCSCQIGIKAKVENRGQYDQYLEELKPLREELGVSLKEDLFPEEK